MLSCETVYSVSESIIFIIYVQQLNKCVVYTHAHTKKYIIASAMGPTSLKLINEGPLLHRCLLK